MVVCFCCSSNSTHISGKGICTIAKIVGKVRITRTCSATQCISCRALVISRIIYITIGSRFHVSYGTCIGLWESITALARGPIHTCARGARSGIHCPCCTLNTTRIHVSPKSAWVCATRCTGTIRNTTAYTGCFQSA
jgi:hypothetical protein